MSTDHFEVSVNLDSKPNTRRGYLGHVSKIYDPLGFVQPFLLPARRILQDLCSEGYGWDDEITGNLKDEFEKWLVVLPELNKLTVPRCYKPEGFVPKTVQLHVFCDASNIGYGAVAYLRLEDVSGNVHCAFVKGASRVSPKKPVTIPRLELIAAVSAAELGRTVLKELDYTVDDTFYWSDSLTVLYMLNNCSQRFKTFVANRISLIHSCSKISQWNHVGSKSNPADIASRGLMPDKLASADLWFHGPEFLWKHDSHWPKFPTCAVKSYNASKITCEIKANYINCEMVPVPEPKSALSNLLTRFSTFERLQRSVAWILRFKNYVKWKFTKNEPPSTGCLSVSELNTATLEICKLMQRESLSPELNYYGERIDPGPSGLHSNGRPP